MSRVLEVREARPGVPFPLPEVGDILVKADGSRWRVDCMTEDRLTLRLSPVGLWHRLYWWVRLRLPVGWCE